MKTKMQLVLFGMLLVLGLTNVKAELPNFRPYGGLDYMFIDTVLYGGEATLGAVRGKLGAELNPYLALEASAGTGVVSDHSNKYSNPNWELEEIWGIYVRGILPLHERVKLYGLFGITRMEFKVDWNYGEVMTVDNYATSGYSYGFGVEAFPLDNLSLVVEFVSLIDELEITDSRDENNSEISAITLGAKYYF